MSKNILNWVVCCIFGVSTYDDTSPPHPYTLDTSKTSMNGWEWSLNGCEVCSFLPGEKERRFPAHEVCPLCVALQHTAMLSNSFTYQAWHHLYILLNEGAAAHLLAEIFYSRSQKYFDPHSRPPSPPPLTLYPGSTFCHPLGSVLFKRVQL